MTITRHSHSLATVTTPQLCAAAARGAFAGLVGSLLMAAYAMTAAATYEQTGFFTPMYHIASTFITPDAMAASMLQEASGHAFTFLLGPFLLGAFIHMAVGASYGAVFGVFIRLVRISGPWVLIAGLVWGVVVFVLSSCIGLPTAAALFDAGYPIANMATMVGYPTFLIEHLMYGSALGAALGDPLMLPNEFARR
jgi:hypothetical protein